MEKERAAAMTAADYGISDEDEEGGSSEEDEEKEETMESVAKVGAGGDGRAGQGARQQGTGGAPQQLLRQPPLQARWP
jgi:hypothetical protein